MHLPILVTSCSINIGNQVWFDVGFFFSIIPLEAYIIPVLFPLVLSYMLRAKCNSPWILLFLSVVTWHQVFGARAHS